MCFLFFIYCFLGGTDVSLWHNLTSLCSFRLRSVAVMSFKKSVMVSYGLVILYTNSFMCR